MTPDCMDAEELALWRAGAEYLAQWSRSPMTDPCGDCVPAFAADMGKLGRCNGTPGGLPIVVSEDAVRERNRAAQERWRVRNRDAIRERRRDYFAARHRNTIAIDELRTGTLG